jgi:hypothetical protein
MEDLAKRGWAQRKQDIYLLNIYMMGTTFAFYNNMGSAIQAATNGPQLTLRR